MTNYNILGPFDWPKSFQEFNLETYTILLTLGGSRSYGTSTPNSDWDYKGICIPPSGYTNNPFKSFEQCIWKSEEESGRLSEIAGTKEKLYEATVFSLNKFFKLCSECNPNVLEILFTRDEDLILSTNEGLYLRHHRDLFLSNRVLYSFTGYAISQLKRIETHKSWINQGDLPKPERQDFSLLDNSKTLNESELQACINFINQRLITISPWLEQADNEDKEKFFYSVAAMVSSILQIDNFQFDPELNNWIQIQDAISEKLATSLGFDTSFTDYLKREKAYFKALRHYKQYMSWKENRNKERALTEHDYGYDVKHGMHLVRLLTMGRELLTTGTLNVYRPDRDMLLDIRHGKWSYEKIITFAKEEEKALYSIVKEGKSVLPDKPDYKKLEQLYYFNL